MKLDSSNACSPVITASSSKACPVFSVTNFSRFFLKNPVILGIIGIVFGCIIALFGRKFFPITIFATGGVAGFGITMLLFSMLAMLDSMGTKSELSFIGTLFSFVISTMVGIFLGFIL